MPTVKVTASGKAAHAGNHHADGANAIWALSRFIMRVSQAHPDVRFTAIGGGETRNTVPDHASATMTITSEALSLLDWTTDIPGTTLSHD